jgi:hypothetical protein
LKEEEEEEELSAQSGTSWLLNFAINVIVSRK